MDSLFSIRYPLCGLVPRGAKAEPAPLRETLTPTPSKQIIHNPRIRRPSTGTNLIRGEVNLG